MSMFLAIAAAILPTASLTQENTSGGQHAVFVMTNAADLNEIVAYQRAENGTPREGNTFLTRWPWKRRQ